MALTILPNSGQTLDDTRNAIRGNFSSIDTQFAIDHVLWNDPNAGMHNKVTFPVQGSAPAFAAGNNGLYSLLDATTSKNEVYIHKQTSAGTVDIPFTASILSMVAASSNLNGWAYLPNGLLIKWGSQGMLNNFFSVPVKSISGGPDFSFIFIPIVSPFNSNAAGSDFEFTVGVRSDPSNAAGATNGNFQAYASAFGSGRALKYVLIGV